MVDILHKIGVRADIREVYRHLSTIDGLGKWWTREVSGSTTKGNAARFSFGGDSTHMEVRETVEPNLIKWKCVHGPKEWLGTDVTFELSHHDGETEVLFTHSHWEKPSNFMHFCSTKWAMYLLSLKACVEQGKGYPYPNDIQIAHGKSAKPSSQSAA